MTVTEVRLGDPRAQVVNLLELSVLQRAHSGTCAIGSPPLSWTIKGFLDSLPLLVKGCLAIGCLFKLKRVKENDFFSSIVLTALLPQSINESLNGIRWTY